MHTVALTIWIDDDWQELLIADLADHDFDAFEQAEDHLRAYLPASRWDDVRREHLEQWLRARGIERPFEAQLIEAQDWNARWEATIEPLAVGPFLIKPSWQPMPPAHADRILIQIDPKMSFGTGYHESTRLVLRFLHDLLTPGAQVLDAGTGSGILAIAAAKLGAAHVLAFDIDPWVSDNFRENVAQNDVADQTTFRLGGLETVPDQAYDLILANINRNILEAYLSGFAEHLQPDGRLVLAGLLRTDREGMLALAARQGFTMQHEATEAEWWSVVLAQAPSAS